MLSLQEKKKKMFPSGFKSTNWSLASDIWFDFFSVMSMPFNGFNWGF